MHKNQIWLAFLATITMIVLWYSAMTVYELYHYATLNAQTLPTEISWSAEKKSAESYYTKANYRYRVKGEIYEGETGLDHLRYRSAAALEEKMGEHSQKKWNVWYAPINPERSTIYKEFPGKSCLYTLILWGLLLYFIWVGFYVGKRMST